MSGDLLVRGGTLVSPRGRRRADVRCRGGLVVEIGPSLEPAGEAILEATGMFVLPGLVDPHVHFALVSPPHRTADDFASGSAAALAGGVTTVIDFARQDAGQTFGEAIEVRRAEAADSRVDYGLHLNPTDVSAGQLDELPELTERGVTSAKLYTTYRPAGFFADDYTILRFMRRAAEVGWVVMVHCENDAIVEGTRAEFATSGRTGFRFHGAARPAIAEIEAVGRVITFAEETRCPVYPVHLSTGRAAELVAEARRRAVPVLGETCPHFLVADETVYANPQRAPRFVHTPPLRTAADREALWAALAGNGLQVVGSDHCGYTLAQRMETQDITKVAPGVPGVETLLPLLYTHGVVTGRLSLERLVGLTSENPARIFGLHPRKGVLEEGSDADLVVYDPNGLRLLRDEEIRSAAAYTPYAGTEIQGRVVATVQRGSVVYDGEHVLAEPGSGMFVPARPIRASDLP